MQVGGIAAYAVVSGDYRRLFGYRRANFFWLRPWDSNFSWLHTTIDASRRLVGGSNLFWPHHPHGR
jgi:hypothetical protein